MQSLKLSLGTLKLVYILETFEEIFLQLDCNPSQVKSNLRLVVSLLLHCLFFMFFMLIIIMMLLVVAKGHLLIRGTEEPA